MISHLLDFLAPRFCHYCRTYLDSQEYLCALCTEQIRPVLSTILKITRTQKISVHAVSAYEDPLRFLIGQRHEYEVAHALATLIGRHPIVSSLSADFLVPIPSDERHGFNRSYIIAQQVSAKSGIPIYYGIQRIASPVKKPYTWYEQVKKAFEFTDLSALAGKSCIILDDVMMTGATLQVVAQELIKVNPKSLQAVVGCLKLKG